MGNIPEKIITKSVPNFGFHKRVLVVGGGADNTLIELVKNQKCEKVTHVDISEVLSIKALVRLQHSGLDNNIEVELIVKDFLSMESETEFDAVVFPYYLDLFLDSEIEENIRQAKQFLSQKGSIYVIDFSSSTESGLWQKIKAWGLYTIFQPVTKVNRRTFPNHQKLFENCGFKVVETESFRNGFYTYARFISSSETKPL